MAHLCNVLNTVRDQVVGGVPPGGEEGVGGAHHQLGGVPDGQVAQLLVGALQVQAGLSSGGPADQVKNIVNYKTDKEPNMSNSLQFLVACVNTKDSLGRGLRGAALLGAGAPDGVAGRLRRPPLPAGGGRQVIEQLLF